MAISEALQTHPSYLAVVAPIIGDDPQGAVCCEHEDYDYILDTLKQVGSLHQDSIVWDTVATKSLQLLEHQRKDINLFAAHLLALLQQNHDGVGFVCVALIQAIVDHWFESAYPATGSKRGIKVWNNRLNQVGLRIKKHAEQQLPNERHLLHQEMVDGLLNTLSNNQLLESVELKAALRYLRDSLAAIQSNAVSQPSKKQSAIPAIQKGISKPSSSVLSSKELKQCYQSIIEHQASTNLYDPMVYRLRRHMLWSGIQSLPDKDAAGKTALFAPPFDLRDFYQQQLQESPTEEVWQRLETSLENSPFWLSGHTLSHQFAVALGYDTVALAIQEEVVNFYQRLPAIEALFFADKASNIPFMDETTQQWLNDGMPKIPEKQAESVVAIESQGRWILDLPLPTKLTEATKQALKDNDVASVLAIFDEYLGQALEPRSRCYAALTLAEAYEKLSMPQLSAAQYHNVWSLLNKQSLQLAHWEPQLLAHVKDKLVALGLTVEADHQACS